MSINYKIIRKKNLKRIYLRVNDNLDVEVRACHRITKKIIDEFVFAKIDWIKRRLNDIQVKHQRQADLSGHLLYLGDYHEMSIKPNHESVKPSISIVGNKAIIKQSLPMDINQLIDQFHKDEAIKYISPMVDLWSLRMNLLPNKIRFRKNKTRWGSCSWENNLSFNYLLMKLPSRIIEYIVVHELAHIKHKNHSNAFWCLVGKYIPDYQEMRKLLRKYEKIIF